MHKETQVFSRQFGTGEQMFCFCLFCPLRARGPFFCCRWPLVRHLCTPLRIIPMQDETSKRAILLAQCDNPRKFSLQFTSSKLHWKFLEKIPF